jgi:hypothetical protein
MTSTLKKRPQKRRERNKYFSAVNAGRIMLAKEINARNKETDQFLKKSIDVLLRVQLQC